MTTTPTSVVVRAVLTTVIAGSAAYILGNAVRDLFNHLAQQIGGLLG